MNRMRSERCITSEAPAGRRRMSQVPEWAWRRPVATVLLFVYGWLPLLPSYALAAPPPLPDHPSFAVASLQGTTPALSELPTCPSPLAGLTAPAAPEAPLGSARLAALPQRGITPNLLPPSILPPPAAATASSHVTAMGRLPLAFIENKGQVDARARFYVRSGSQTVWLTSEGLRFDLLRTKGGAATKLKIPIPDPHHPTPASPPQPQERERLVFAQDFLGGAAMRPTIEARNPLPGIYNFFLGNDPAKWRTEVTGYAELIYREVWDGIDLKLYGNGRALEQEFIVRPGGDLGRIKVAYRGIEGLTVAQDGSLLITTAFGTLKESPPRIYQEIDGKRVEVTGRFKLLNPQSEIPNSQFAYTFEVGPYHPQYALVIDPTLIYSTYLGSGRENAFGIAVDTSGNAYVTGWTSSAFPTTPGAFQNALAGCCDAFVTKLNPTGSALVYSTLLGGGREEVGSGIAVDAAGNAYVTGRTFSYDFPTTPGAVKGTSNGYDAFVTKLNPTGSALVYSTLLGGGSWDKTRAIAVDAAGNAYVTGWTSSSDFPTTPGAFQPAYAGSQGAFVTKLNPTGSALVYSTYLGSGGTESGSGIAVDAAGNAYVTGGTESFDFPTTPGAFQSSFGGITDVFVTKLNPTGSALVYSTYLGGSGREGWEGDGIEEDGFRIAVDAAGNAYVTGGTESSDFPTTPGAFQSTRAGSVDVFVTKLNPTGSALVYSTYLGGSGEEGHEGAGIAVDGSGNAYITEHTWSSDFPTTPGAFQNALASSVDVFVTKLNPTGSALVYSTYLGGGGEEYGRGAGIAVDAAGNAYVTGNTSSGDFPTTPGAFQSTDPDAFYGNAFVARFAFGTLALSASAILPSTGGDTGVVSVLIFGSGYVTGATVKLVQAGQPDIVGDPVTVGADGVSIATTFDLTGKARGLWDVVVTNPDGASATLPGGFTIEEGRAAQVWADIIGRDTVMAGRPQTFYILYGNRGNVDVPATLISVTVPQKSDVAFPAVNPLASLPGGQKLGPPIRLGFGAKKTMPFFLPAIAAGATAVIPMRLTIPVGTIPAHGIFQLGVRWETFAFTLDQYNVPLDPAATITPQLIDITGNTLNSALQVSNASGSGTITAELVRDTVAQAMDPRLDVIESADRLTFIYETTVDDPISLKGTWDFIKNNFNTIQTLFNSAKQAPVAVTAQRQQIQNITVADWLRDIGVIDNPRHDDMSRFAEAALIAQITQPMSNLPGAGNFQLVVDVASSAFEMNLGTQMRLFASGPMYFSNGSAIYRLYKDLELTRPIWGPASPEESNQIIAQVVRTRFLQDLSRGRYTNGQSITNKELVAPGDPNDKIGSQGAGTQHFISGEEPLRYTIFFENEPTATAPAQEVVITDQLDGTKVDLTTFSLGPIAFGDKLINPTPGLREFTTDVDLRPTKNLIVRITAGLDVTTGLATWRYTSIDPATGQLTEDPLGGFLPPNVNPPEGDGSVLFTVMPKKGLATGTEVRNLASIVFDLNPPIATPEWLNTLDNTKPTSQVLPLAATQPSTTFPVQWAGTDEGSGIQDFTIFVSEDGGPYAVWLPNTPDTGGTFTGQPGRRYAFYSVARDQTGNVERKTPAAETTTQLNALPLADAGADQTVGEGTLVTLRGSGSDPDGGPVSFFWTQLSGPPVTLSNPTTATSTFRAFVSSLTAFTFQLTVSDGFTGSTDTVMVTVQDLGPSLHGTVTGSGPVAGAQVVLKGMTRSRSQQTASASSRSTTTDANGEYRITGLPPLAARYMLMVSHPSFKKQKTTYDLGPEEDATLNVSLIPRRR